MLIFKSMAILQKEKLVVVKKELLHLYHIADFYKAKANTPDEEKTQREVISEKIYNDINGYFDYIQELNTSIDTYYQNFGKRKDEFLSFLTLYDFYNAEIKELLKMIQIIKSKFLQFQQEHYNQYMPVPNINKRYSSKGFLDYLKDYHTRILQSAHSDTESPIFLWGYTDSFRAHTSLGKHEKNSEKYIEIPFWNYEIPFMLPIITHEIGHIILDHSQDKEYIKLQNFKNILQTEDIDKVFRENPGFLDEILADIFAYIYHGDSYIISIGHELMGINFATQFYSKNITEPVHIGSIDLNDKTFIEAIVRLKILIFFKYNFSDEAENTFIENIKKVLDWIILDINIPDDKNEDNKDETEKYDTVILDAIKAQKETNLAKIYHSFYNLDQEYIDFHFTIFKHTEAIEKNFKSNEEKIFTIIKSIQKRISLDSKDRLLSYRESFEALSNLRMSSLNKHDNLLQTEVTFKNAFRKEVLSREEVLTEQCLYKNIGSAYELTLFKTRMDRFGSGKQNTYLEKLANEIKDSHNSILLNKRDNSEPNTIKYENDNPIEPKFTFDDYHMLALIKKRESITIEELNLFLKHKNNIKEDTPRYYTNKYSLILLHEKNKDEKKQRGFSAFINLSLRKNDSINTLTAKEELIGIMDENEELTQINYEIYKSLGPKEIVIHIRDTTIDTIYNAKEKLFQNKNKIFHRSHTIIYCDYSQAINITISNPFHCGTLLRAKTGKKHSDFEHTNMRATLMTTGVKDYTIQWKENVKLNEIINYCNNLSVDGMCTDVQTFIAKKIDPETC